MVEEGKSNLIGIREAAKFLNLKVSRLRAAIFRKEIPYLKIGALVKFDIEDLIEWIESRKIKSTY